MSQGVGDFFGDRSLAGAFAEPIGDRALEEYVKSYMTLFEDATREEAERLYYAQPDAPLPPREPAREPVSVPDEIATERLKMLQRTQSAMQPQPPTEISPDIGEYASATLASVPGYIGGSNVASELFKKAGPRTLAAMPYRTALAQLLGGTLGAGTTALAAGPMVYEMGKGYMNPEKWDASRHPALRTGVQIDENGTASYSGVGDEELVRQNEVYNDAMSGLSPLSPTERSMMVRPQPSASMRQAEAERLRAIKAQEEARIAKERDWAAWAHGAGSARYGAPPP